MTEQLSFCRRVGEEARLLAAGGEQEEGLQSRRWITPRHVEV